MIKYLFEEMGRFISMNIGVSHRGRKKESVVADSSVSVKEHQSIEYPIQETVEVFIKPDNVKERTCKAQ
jgi:hypothetical protein